MLVDNEKNFSPVNMLVDAVAVGLSYLFAWLMRFVGPFSDTAVRAKFRAIYDVACLYYSAVSAFVSGFYFIHTDAYAGTPSSAGEHY